MQKVKASPRNSVGVASERRKRLVRDLYRLGYVVVGYRVAHKMVVVVREEHAALHALRNPALVQGEAGVVGYTQIEQRGSAAGVQVISVFFRGCDKPVGKLFAFFVQQLRQIEPFHLFDTCDACGKRYG